MNPYFTATTDMNLLKFIFFLFTDLALINVVVYFMKQITNQINKEIATSDSSKKETKNIFKVFLNSSNK
jgi:hypothetical protein